MFVDIIDETLRINVVTVLYRCNVSLPLTRDALFFGRGRKITMEPCGLAYLDANFLCSSLIGRKGRLQLTPKPTLPHTLDPSLEPGPNRCEGVVLRSLRCSTATPLGPKVLDSFKTSKNSLIKSLHRLLPLKNELDELKETLVTVRNEKW